MANRQQDVIYYRALEEHERTQTSESSTNNRYAHLVFSTTQANEADRTITLAETDLTSGNDAWLNKKDSKVNRTVSSLMKGINAGSLLYSPNGTDRKQEPASTNLPIEKENTSYQFNKADMWSTTHQNSGWLDIYLNTTTTALPG